MTVLRYAQMLSLATPALVDQAITQPLTDMNVMVSDSTGMMILVYFITI